MSFRVVILDFDGTLVESVGIKDRAFEQLYGDLPEWPAIEAYHLSHNHTIRFEKFRHIATEILGEEYGPEDEAALSTRFSELVASAVAEAPEVPGATELLDVFDASGVRVYLLSMSPAEELAGILGRRGLARRFAGIYAHPWAKVDAIDAILKRECADRDEVVLVGDTPEDAEAAVHCGVGFVGRFGGRAMPEDVPVFKDLVGVASYLADSLPVVERSR